MAKLNAFNIVQTEASTRLQKRVAAADPIPQPIEQKMENPIPTVQPGRQGKARIVAHIPDAARDSLKIFAIQHGTTVEKLIIAGLDRLLMDMGQDWTIGTGDEFQIPLSKPKKR